MRTHAIRCLGSVVAAVTLTAAFVAPASAVPGQLDASFGTGGTGTALRGANVAILVQSDGKVLSVGEKASGPITIERENANGTRDTSYGTGGVRQISAPGGGSVFGAALQSDGKLVIAGNANNFSDIFVARFTTSGALDTTFSSDGIVTTHTGSASSVAISVAIAPGNKIVAAGTIGNDLGIVRYLTNGTPDSTFGTGGVVRSVLGPDSQAHDVVVQPDGKVVVSGSTSTSNGQLILARYTTAGVLDATFGTGGRASASSTSVRSGDSLLMQGTKFIVGGVAGSNNVAAGVARFTSAGVIDTTFGSHGTRTLSAGPFTRANHLVFDNSGNIVVVGVSALNLDFPGVRTFLTIFRLTAAGAVDGTFGCNGKVVSELLGNPTNSTRYQGSAGATAAVTGTQLLVGAVGTSDVPVDLPPFDLLVARYDLSGGTVGHGYTLVRTDGGTSAFGDAPACGSVADEPLVMPVVGAANDPVAKGSWSVASDGGIFSFGSAKFFGSMGGKHLDKPIVGIAPTADGKGYWLVASDGGIFAFGSAKFFGSMGGKRLDSGIAGMAPAADGKGYWLVGSDGGMFAFGSAKFFGSMGGKHLDAGVVGMAATRDGNGYYLVASDGGIFAFGPSAKFFGSMGGRHLNDPVVGIATDADGSGYWMAGMDGGVFSFNAPFLGSTGATPFGVQAVRAGRFPRTTIGITATAPPIP